MLNFTDTLESAKIFQLLSRSLPYYLKSWHDEDERCGLFGVADPEAFNMRAVASSSPVIEYVLRPHLHICCILASFLYKNELSSLEGIITGDEAMEKVLKGLRWACDTHLTGSRDVESFLERKRWGENWRSGLWATMLALCSFLSKGFLPGDIIEAINTILAFEADRFIDLQPPSGYETDTKLEENAHDVLVLSWAVNMLPEHPHAPDWEKSLRLWALNIASCVHDKADHTDYFGKSVSRQVTTQTLYPDMTAENHGFFHPLTLSYTAWVVLAMSAYAFRGKESPFYLRRKHHQETFDIMLRFCLPTGMLYEPGGQDLPMFVPRPFSFAWGLWNNDPRALRMTSHILSWMDTIASAEANTANQWILGFAPVYEGWELFFQSQVGFELALCGILPCEKEIRFYSLGQIENAVDTRRIYPYIQICYRRNTRTSRSVAWKAIGNHPLICLNMHDQPELIAAYKAGLLGIPSVKEKVVHWDVQFHHDRIQKDGFDTYGRIVYLNESREPLLRRDVRVLTWGEEGLIVFDQITAEKKLSFNEQYLSPVYFVNDYWTSKRLLFNSGSLRELFVASEKKHREISCPAFWASVENHFLFQFVWGRTRGLIYLPGGERNAPPYWQNCRLDMMAIRTDAQEANAGTVVYNVGFYVGAGKGPRPFKAAGTAGEFFKGLVIMDGKNTIGLD
jgi:hypothetical protein